MPETVPLTPDRVAAVTWAMLAKVAAKEKRRDLLAAGGSYKGQLYLVAEIGGARFMKLINTELSVGHSSRRGKSVAPNPTALVALILSKLNTATRERLVRDLPELFAAAGNRLPEVEPVMLTLADSLVTRLRAKETHLVEGTVSCRYMLADA